MAKLLRFSRQDIEALAEKLSEILADENLGDGEKRLLLAILQVAAENAYQPVPTPDILEVEGLREQIIRSFVPDQEQGFALHADFKIGVQPSQWPPKK